MSYTVQYFDIDQADEFEVVAKHIVKKLGVNGWGPFNYDQYHYALNTERKSGTDRSVKFFYPEPKKVEATEVAEITPTVVTRGRGRAPKAVPPATLSSIPQPSSGRETVHKFRPISTNASSSEDDDNEGIAHYYNDSKTFPRVLWLKDFETPEKLSNKLNSLVVSGNRGRRGTSLEDLSKRPICIATGFIIEGIDFNISEDKSPKLQTLQFGNKTFYLFDKFYIGRRSTDNMLIRRYIKTRPIDKTKFLVAITNHFLSRVQNTRKEKMTELQKLKLRLFTLEKEVGESIFVENAINNSSNTHFEDIIKSIEAIPSVDKLEFNGSGFKITTKDLWAECGETDHYIGVFEVSVELTTELRAYYRNIAAPDTGGRWSQHPHGSCTGSHHMAMLSALRNLDYYTFVLAAIEMLQTVNPREKSSAGMINDGWPTEKPKKFKEFTNTVSLMVEEKIAGESEAGLLEDSDLTDLIGEPEDDSDDEN
jgi:hypothetical protein